MPRQATTWARILTPSTHYLAVIRGVAFRVSRTLSGNGWRLQRKEGDSWTQVGERRYPGVWEAQQAAELI